MRMGLGLGLVLDRLSSMGEGRDSGGKFRATSPEDEAEAQRLAQELRDTPAINCSFAFNWSGTREASERVVFLVMLYGQVMRQERQATDFSLLKGVVVHHDYDRAVNEAGTGRPDAPAPTKEPGGLSMAMMVPCEGGVRLVFHESIGLALVSEVRAERDLAQSVVRHELSHVDDWAYLRSLKEKAPGLDTFDGFEASIAPLAETLWAEFYANKYSHGPWSDPRTSFTLLKDALPTVKEQVVGAIGEYRVSADLAKLRRVVEPKARFVAQCFGYAMGTLAALGEVLDVGAPEETKLLQKVGLLAAWNECFGLVRALDARRPNWASMLELRVLFPGCIALFAGLGLHYSPRGDGGHISVPYTAETGWYWGRG